VKTVAGVISDTHGLVRPEVREVFEGMDVILHGGDIGAAEVLNELRSIAPVVAVRGNNDRGDWAKAIPKTVSAAVGDLTVYLLHDLKELDVDPARAGVHIVISGHSHCPLIDTRDGVLFINPGSAGPRRFKLPVTVARLTVEDGVARAALIPLLS
jgi:putative phosphoesterase